MGSDITDIWFRTGRSLVEVAEVAGVQDPDFDRENYWEWVIGSVEGTSIDITRTHTRPAAQVDTRIFLVGGGRFSPRLIRHLVGRLGPVADGAISCGRWLYLHANDFDKRTVEVHGESSSSS